MCALCRALGTGDYNDHIAHLEAEAAEKPEGEHPTSIPCSACGKVLIADTRIVPLVALGLWTPRRAIFGVGIVEFPDGVFCLGCGPPVLPGYLRATGPDIPQRLGTTKAEPTCRTCNDTHRMAWEDREVPCTACPSPCQHCRSRYQGVRIGAYCETTPCPCRCHAYLAEQRRASHP